MNLVLLYDGVVPTLEIAGFYPLLGVFFAFFQPFVFLIIEGDIQDFEFLFGKFFNEFCQRIASDEAFFVPACPKVEQGIASLFSGPRNVFPFTVLAREIIDVFFVLPGVVFLRGQSLEYHAQDAAILDVSRKRSNQPVDFLCLYRQRQVSLLPFRA